MTWFDKLKDLMQFYDLFTPTEKLQADIVKIIHQVQAEHTEEVFSDLKYHPFQYPGHEALFASYAYHCFKECTTIEEFKYRLAELERDHYISMPIMGLKKPKPIVPLEDI